MTDTDRTNPRTKYITYSLAPALSAGPNRHGSRTNAEWLKAECDRGRAAGMNFVVVVTPTGSQALARHGRIHPADEILYPRHLRPDPIHEAAGAGEPPEAP